MLCFQKNFSFRAWSGYSDPAMINISLIDLNLFVAFDAIYTEGGITRAGEVLKLTQPAVSHPRRACARWWTTRCLRARVISSRRRQWHTN